MKVYIVIIICFCCAFAKAYSKQLKGTEVVQKSINYHDPNNNWQNFAGEFTLVLDMPDKEPRKSVITLDLVKEYFNVSTEQEGETSFREISNDLCRFTGEDKEVQTSDINSDDCERTRMFRNYYTYLYGLPMKLKDNGTNIQEKVRQKVFKGKEYLVVKVTYDDAVGADTWQFYFDPETYAMEVYQFFKDADEKTGEYILLADVQEVNGIKMPKDRAWYYNKDDGYLGTDRMVIQ